MFRRRHQRQSNADADRLAELTSLVGQSPPHWRQPVERALTAQRVWNDALACLSDGPLQQKLRTDSSVIDDAIVALTSELRAAIEANRLLQSLRAQETLDELKQARRDLEASAQRGQHDPTLQARVVNLETRHRALSQAANLVEDAGDRLEEIASRLETLAAQATAISLAPDHNAQFATHQRLDDLAVAVDTLRASLDRLP